MPLNNDKPHLWKKDIAESVDLFNAWFLESAPAAFRENREGATRDVLYALKETSDLRNLSAEVLRLHPLILPTLRMSTAPPIARDRLIGLSKCSRNLVRYMENRGKLPPRMPDAMLEEHTQSICEVIQKASRQRHLPMVGYQNRTIR